MLPRFLFLLFLGLECFSPTAGSVGVSAQIGSGVVRGGLATRVPPRFDQFHQASTRVPLAFKVAWIAVCRAQRLRGGPGWFHEFHQGSTRVPPGFHQGSTRVPPAAAGWAKLGKGQELNVLGGPWFEVRLHEGFRDPRCSARAVGWFTKFHRILQGFHKAPQGSTRLVPEMFCKVPWFALVVRPPSEKPSVFLGLRRRITKQKRSQWFLAHVHSVVTCSLAQATRPEMLASWQIRSRCCGTHGAAE